MSKLLARRNTFLMARRPVPPHAYFVGSAVFHYLGPSFAVLLFARVDVLGVAWLRIASAAAILAIWRRPLRKLGRVDRGGRLLLVALGAVFASMNACFYGAIDRLPLATVAAIEFIGPILLALAGARVARNFAAVCAAAVGVYLLTRARFVGEPGGVGFAFANASLFTAYRPRTPGGAALVDGRSRRACSRDDLCVRRRLADRVDRGGTCSDRPDCARGGHRCRTDVVRDSVRLRPVRDGAPPARDVRALRCAAPGDGDGDRRDRPAPAAYTARPGRDRPRDARRRTSPSRGVTRREGHGEGGDRLHRAGLSRRRVAVRARILLVRTVSTS